MEMISIRDGFYERDGFMLQMDFGVLKGSIVAVLGPSGAGKSTLLNVLSGFEDLQKGSVILGGVDHAKSAPADRPVNVVFQDNNTFAHLTARNNVALGVSPSLRLSQDAWTRVDAALQDVGLADLAHRKPGGMSGGERQRIALARALVRQKPILLLDEAFAALGPALRQEMLALIKTLARAHALTVLMVTHQPEDAKAIADQVMYVDGGVVSPPVAVNAFLKSQDRAIRAYLDISSSPP
jgi:thiamine transport system ATP-binding protein